MPKTIWTCLVLVSLFFILTESKKGGKPKTGGWGSSSGSNRNPSNPGNTGSNWNPNYGNRGGQNPAYPGQSGSNRNPNPGSSWNQGGGYNYNPGGSSYNKQWKNDKKKPNYKMIAGAAVAGVAGGFILGSAYSNMRYNFGNDMDYRYYNTYRNEMPNQVYRPQYQGNPYVSQDRFVSDCFNTTMTEYVIKPNEEKNSTEVNETEVRVKSTIIRELCVTEYKRSPEYNYDAYNSFNSGMKMIFSSSLTFFVPLFVYFVVQ